MSNRVAHFEIPSDDPEASMKFFKEAFDWEFKQSGKEPYWFAITGDEKSPGINGAVMKKLDPKQPVANTIYVQDIGEAIRKIVDAGGSMVLPKKAVPNIGWLAYFTDPDGNIHGVMEEDNKAQ
jgi:predicted enzyme related to lactoylglutathione lyase